MSAATMSRRPDTEPTHACTVCGAGINGDHYICGRCRAVLAGQLGDYWHRAPTPHGLTLNLLDELTITATRLHRTAVADDGSRSTERLLPYAPHAADILADDTAYLLAAATHLGAPQVLRRTRNAVACARWLTTQLDTISGHPDGGEFATDINRRHHRATDTIDRRPDTWYAGKCLACTADLYALDGAVRIDCTVCSATHDVAAQRTRLLLAVEDTLASAGEICRAVHLLDRAVSRSQIDNWVARGHLHRRGLNLHGHHTYRIGDVLDLVARS